MQGHSAEHAAFLKVLRLLLFAIAGSWQHASLPATAKPGGGLQEIIRTVKEHFGPIDAAAGLLLELSIRSYCSIVFVHRHLALQHQCSTAVHMCSSSCCRQPLCCAGLTACWLSKMSRLAVEHAGALRQCLVDHNACTQTAAGAANCQRHAFVYPGQQHSQPVDATQLRWRLGWLMSLACMQLTAGCTTWQQTHHQ